MQHKVYYVRINGRRRRYESTSIQTNKNRALKKLWGLVIKWWVLVSAAAGYGPMRRAAHDNGRRTSLLRDDVFCCSVSRPVSTDFAVTFLDFGGKLWIVAGVNNPDAIIQTSLVEIY